ncbi:MULTISPECIES: cell division protein SepF [Janibacter]|uniref:Cell division protein SepF n=1 Tax=Janibacter indicus TaxID=857417 RepID=A0A1W2AD29_9MICO|nr:MULTISPECIES: cell division protein SepF [Janibacter]QNF95288.1 cell division protein SepF [Janibacter sp. YB324]SMC58625.1 cell division inhibitor SepF [Janibacter indicus]
MTALRNAMVYLGLAEDDKRYDEYDDYVDEYDAGHEVLEEEHAAAEVTPLRRVPTTPAVREVEVTPMNRITTIHPSTYNDARAIGESFRNNTPVIMNLSDMDDSDAKRLVDFAAGLVFGLHGSIERVTNKVFLLSPEHIEVDAEGGEAPQPRALFNQS